MKKILFFAVAFFVANAAMSQTYQGQWLIGGNVGLQSQKFTKGSGGSTTYFDLNLNGGYFFVDNLAGGLRVKLESLKQEDQDPNSTFLISPFVRYYFLPPTNKVNVFADASYGIGSTGAGNKEGINQWAIMAGPAVFLTPNIALEFALKYANTGGDAYDVSNVNNRLSAFGFNAGFQLHLGAKK